MEVTKGKLKNTKSGKELVFGSNPTQYEISHSNDFAIETQLAQCAPLVSFRCAGAASLRVQLVFDQDAGAKEGTLGEVASFLQELNQVDGETASVPPAEFKMGSTVFRGFLRSYRWNPTRFNPKGEPTAAHLSVELLSDGSYEKGEAK